MEKSFKRKINIFGKVGKIITTIIIVLLLIAEGAMAAVTIAAAILPKDIVSADVDGRAEVKFDASFFGVDDEKISLDTGNGHIKVFSAETNAQIQSKDGVITLDAQSGKLHFDMLDVIKLLIAGMIKLAAIIVPLYFFKALMKAFMTCDTPFCDNVIKKMRAFAIALIPSMAVSAFFHNLLGLLFTDSFSFGNVDLIPVLFVFVVFILTAIFKYGAQLQKEYDETV